jgi:predicted transcriptional regulator
MMHPKEREYLDEASTLLVTVETDQQFHEEVTANLERLERGDSAQSTPTLSFHSYDDLMSTFTPTTLDLIATIRREQPTSMNEAARAVERDVKNVHEQLTRLESLGVIYFAEEGQSKRPVVWFDDIMIDIDVTTEQSSGPHVEAPG